MTFWPTSPAKIRRVSSATCPWQVTAAGVATALSLCASVHAEVTKTPPTTVGELVVDGRPPPKVVASYPADGQAVAGGVLVIKITFDEAMSPNAWSFGRSDAGDYPGCLPRPRLLNDGRTFALLCTVAAHSAFAIQVNAEPRFANTAGRPATPKLVKFSTSDTGPMDLHDALVEAGLTDTDDPIMEPPLAEPGVRNTSPIGAPP